ncbi:MAG: hypothetical protein U0929_16145 [Planctomycetaceae bacterium]
MDKLQPILRNQFWILLVPLFSMNLWGYFSANSQLRAATEARQKELDSVKSGIPAGTTDPNASYTEELKKTNDVLVTLVDKELLDLWNRQKKRMVWPPRVAADIPKVYKSEIKNRQVRLAYQKDFPLVRQQVFETVEPYVFDRKGITWTPKVDFPIEFINPYWAPTNLAIESTTMWDNQEDLWLTQLILEAIREVNKDADSESSAMVRKVINFRLLGGNGESSVMPVEGGGGNDFEDEESVGVPRRAMGPSAAIATSVAFDPSEEFGTGGDPSMMTTGRGIAPVSEDEEMDAEEPTGPLRYVKEDEAAPYVQRGFYLSVIINQNKVVDFLIALANSEWPTQVTRFHFGKNPYGGPDPFAARGVANRAGQARPGIRFSDDDDEGPRGGRGARPMNVPGPPRQQDEGGFGFGRGAVGGPRVGGLPGAAPTAGNSGYPQDALLHPDLVQLDLTGLITIYRQPKSEIPEEAGESTDGAAPADGSAEAAEGEMASEEPAAPAAEGEEAPTASAKAADAKAETEMEGDPGSDAAATADAESEAADEFAAPDGSVAKPAAEKPAAEGEAPAGSPAPGSDEKPAGDDASAAPTEGEADPNGESTSDEFSSPVTPAEDSEKAPGQAPEKPSTP